MSQPISTLCGDHSVEIGEATTAGTSVSVVVQTHQTLRNVDEQRFPNHCRTLDDAFSMIGLSVKSTHVSCFEGLWL
jgi:hypothetical protein